MSRSLFFILSVYSCCRVSKSILLILFLKILLLGYNCFQCCVDFCCTTKRISCVYTYIPTPFSLPPTIPPSHPSKSSQSPKLRSVFYKASKKGQSQRTNL